MSWPLHVFILKYLDILINIKTSNNTISRSTFLLSVSSITAVTWFCLKHSYKCCTCERKWPSLLLNTNHKIYKSKMMFWTFTWVDVVIYRSINSFLDGFLTHCTDTCWNFCATNKFEVWVCCVQAVLWSVFVWFFCLIYWKPDFQ